jgi:hypothetical protein
VLDADNFVDVEFAVVPDKQDNTEVPTNEGF